MSIGVGVAGAVGTEDAAPGEAGTDAAAFETSVIEMFEVPLSGWGMNVTYHERLKPSYYLVQQMWAEGVDPEDIWNVDAEQDQSASPDDPSASSSQPSNTVAEGDE